MAENNEYLQRQIWIEQRLTNEGKSLAAAYILWWFLGLFGAHRFYLDKSGTAIAQLLCTILIIGLPVSFIWWIIDAALIPSLARECNDRLRIKLERQIFTAAAPAA